MPKAWPASETVLACPFVQEFETEKLCSVHIDVAVVLTLGYNRRSSGSIKVVIAGYLRRIAKESSVKRDGPGGWRIGAQPDSGNGHGENRDGRLGCEAMLMANRLVT